MKEPAIFTTASCREQASRFDQPRGWVGIEPTFTRSNRTLRHGQIDERSCREQAITVRLSALPLSYPHHSRVRGRSRTCDLSLTRRSNCGLHHCQTGSGSASCTRDLQVMSLTRYCSSIPQNWCPEKCSHLRLLLFRQALELSQLSRRDWYAWPGSNRLA